MIKIDLHTHSVASYDGSITEKEYEEIIAKRALDVVAITDHNSIDFAIQMHQKLGDSVIVGEEIMTNAGEIIGLFLAGKVAPFQSVAKTIQLIHDQGGLVYIPHPFDSFRKGIGGKILREHMKNIDIIEGCNGRMIFRWQNSKAEKFAKQHNMPMVASSDAHSAVGLGRTYIEVDSVIRSGFVEQLKNAKFSKKYQPFAAYLSPFLNRLKKQ